jgi:hypothetical protein
MTTGHAQAPVSPQSYEVHQRTHKKPLNDVAMILFLYAWTLYNGDIMSAAEHDTSR